MANGTIVRPNCAKGMALLIVGALVLSGCATRTDNSTDSISPSPLIAHDLVGVLMQLDSLSVETTILKLSPVAFTDDEFALALRRSLEDAGYAIRISGSSPGEQSVSFSVTRKSDPNAGSVSTYTVSAGDISVRRSYVSSNDGVIQPMAAMQVRGADASAVTSNDALFSTASVKVSGELSSQDRTVEPLVLPTQPAPTTDTDGTETTLQPVPQIIRESRPLVSPAIQAAVTQPQPQPQIQTQPQPQPLFEITAPSLASASPPIQEFGTVERLSDLPRQNVRTLGESNFTSIFNDYGIVDEAVLRFDNDSVRMGQGNKARVRRFVDQFDANSDVVSVIGCSHGPTGTEIGQEGLALGRAERVKEELLYSGIPVERIYDEGCWADDYFDTRMPRRGVVLTLKRRAS